MPKIGTKGKTYTSKKAGRTINVTKTDYTRRGLKAHKAELLQGATANVQKARIAEEGKTSRTKARAAAVTATGVAAANNAPDQTIVYSGMAGGGLGDEISENTVTEKPSSSGEHEGYRDSYSHN